MQSSCSYVVAINLKNNICDFDCSIRAIIEIKKTAWNVARDEKQSHHLVAKNSEGINRKIKNEDATI